MTEWLSGPKSPGLMILEHELSDESVQAFLDAWPVIKSNGWNTMSMARVDGGSAYQNADNNKGDVDVQDIIDPKVGAAKPTDPDANAPGSSSSSSSSGSSSSVAPTSVSTSSKAASSSKSSSAAASATPTSSQSNTNAAMRDSVMSSWSLYTIIASSVAFGAQAFF